MIMLSEYVILFCVMVLNSFCCSMNANRLKENVYMFSRHLHYDPHCLEDLVLTLISRRVEKKRRAYLSQCYSYLQRAVPALTLSRASNVKILRGSLHFIKGGHSLHYSAVFLLQPHFFFIAGCDLLPIFIFSNTVHSV